MSIKNKIQWLATAMSMAVLKRSLRYRLQGDGSNWLQKSPSANIAIYNRVDFILNYCRDKRVLHVGFTDQPFTIDKLKDGTLLHTQLQAVSAALAGIDADVNAIEQYRGFSRDTNVFYGNVMLQYPAEALVFHPEVVLFTEVLEHLNDPYKAVDILYNSFPAGTAILVTVPNYTSFDSIASSLHQTESIHPDHYWYFSPYTLRRLFDDKRFELQQMHFGMYYQRSTAINPVLKQYPFNGDCIMAVFLILKKQPL